MSFQEGKKGKRETDLDFLPSLQLRHFFSMATKSDSQTVPHLSQRNKLTKMASTTISQKRKSATPSSFRYDLILSKRQQINAMDVRGKATLLGIPRELRDIILRELLFRSEPIEFISYEVQYHHSTAPLPPRLLWPEILNTCRRLNAEGSDILYSNTAKCRLGLSSIQIASGQNLARMSLLKILSRSHETLPEQFVRERLAVVSRRIQKFSIDIQPLRPSCGYHWTDLGYSKTLMHAVRQLARTMKSCPNWKHISINVKSPYTPSGLSTAGFHLYLQPFKFVRNRDSVTVTGILPKEADQLEKSMVLKEPVTDLDFIYDATMDYVASVVEGNAKNTWNVFTDTEPHRWAMDKARDSNQVAPFFKARDRLLKWLVRYDLDEKAKVFQYDLPKLTAGSAFG